jgi:DNA-binding transcriptional MerR regulator
MTTPGMISIGKRSGVLAKTICYYEVERLLRKPEHTAGGYRLYDASDAERRSFIRRARDLGFKLDAARRLERATKGQCGIAVALAVKWRPPANAGLGGCGPPQPNRTKTPATPTSCWGFVFERGLAPQ